MKLFNRMWMNTLIVLIALKLLGPDIVMGALVSCVIISFVIWIFFPEAFREE